MTGAVSSSLHVQYVKPNSVVWNVDVVNVGNRDSPWHRCPIHTQTLMT